MAIYAIGDIQGCDAEFGQLLDRLRFDPATDRLWLTGDLVNRGPASLAVLRRVRALGTAAITVLGNHDLHLLALASNAGEPFKDQDTLDDVLAAPDADELLGWLRTRPLLHHDAALGYALVHAGLAPQWNLELAERCARELESALREEDSARALFAHMYGNRPDRWDDRLEGFDRLRFITNCLTRLRFCDSEGRIDLKFKGSMADAPPGLYPWFRAPGRQSRDLNIVCGHWSALGFYRGDGVLAIDTGCVWGGKLCAIRLDTHAPPVFVPCSSSGRAYSD